MLRERWKKHGRGVIHEDSVQVEDDLFLGTDRCQCRWRTSSRLYYHISQKSICFLLSCIVPCCFIVIYFNLDQSCTKAKMLVAQHTTTPKGKILKPARYHVYQGQIDTALLFKENTTTNSSSSLVLFEQHAPINSTAKSEQLPKCPNGMNIPGVSIHGTILHKSFTSFSRAWGNVLSPYWAARVMAQLGGYDYQGSVLGQGTWMEFLPTMVSRRPPKPELYNRVCSTCTRWEYFHECHYGWGYIQKTIFHDIRNAIETYVQIHNKTELINVHVTNQFQATDWLIYDRCCIFCHGTHGISDIYAYDNIPTEGTFTVYTLSPPYHKIHESNGMCQPALHKLRDVYLKWRNPNITIVPLANSEQWVDWARLVYAPNLLLPSVGTSFGLWAALANVKVITGPPMKGILLDSLPDTFHIYSSSKMFGVEAKEYFGMKSSYVRSRVLQWWLNDVSFEAIDCFFHPTLVIIASISCDTKALCSSVRPFFTFSLLRTLYKFFF